LRELLLIVTVIAGVIFSASTVKAPLVIQAFDSLAFAECFIFLALNAGPVVAQVAEMPLEVFPNGPVTRIVLEERMFLLCL
jgi:hypothetical protein